jgi:hypothetical protein
VRPSQDEAYLLKQKSLVLRFPSLASRAHGEASLRPKLGLLAERLGLEGRTRALSPRRPPYGFIAFLR